MFHSLDEIIFLFLTAVNSVAIAFIRWEAKKMINGKKPEHSTDEIWGEILDIRSTENKILEGMNKWLRKHGRTLQSEQGVTPLQRRKGSGMILPHAPERTN